mgnify:CR=1 FL=1
MKTDGYVADVGVDAIKLELQNDGCNANADTECMNLGYLLSRETRAKAFSFLLLKFLVGGCYLLSTALVFP